MSEKDELAGVIADELNKQFKHQKVAYFLEEGGNPTDVTGWISTGSTMLDLAISNKPNGGVVLAVTPSDVVVVVVASLAFSSSSLGFKKVFNASFNSS